MTKCEKDGEHRFVARYSDVTPAFILELVRSGQRGEFGSIAFERVYEGDVCTRCGLVVNSKGRGAGGKP